MTHLKKLSFLLLVHDGDNYLIWAFDAKLNLQARNFAKKIEESSLEILTYHYDP